MLTIQDSYNFNLKLMPVCYFRWPGRLSGTISVARRQIHVRLRHADMFMSFFMSQKIPERSSINHLNFYCIKQIASILPLSVQLYMHRRHQNGASVTTLDSVSCVAHVFVLTTFCRTSSAHLQGTLRIRPH